MGNAYSKNIATNAINQSLSISNNTLTNCNTNASQNQTINIGSNCCKSSCFSDKDCGSAGHCILEPGSPLGVCSNGNACDIVIKNVDITQFQSVTVNSSCLESGSTSSTINAQISQAASQLADSVNQNLNLNPGSTEAEI